jgi:glutamate dehydrogenase (NAD(P)+)
MPKENFESKEGFGKDSFGPEYIVRVYDPKVGMEGFLVIDNTTIGIGKGGIRMTPTVTEEEVRRLARAMTWKNALAGIPFGGAKSGLVMPREALEKTAKSRALKKKIIEAFARRLQPLLVTRYVAGPDVNSGEEEMRWFAEAAKDWRAATGKPGDYARKGAKKGTWRGLPHELGSTGFGVAHATAVAAKALGINIKGASVAIEGFGNVGTFAFEHLAAMGAKIVAVADSRTAAYKEDGLDYGTAIKTKKKHGNLSAYPGAKGMHHDDIFGLPVDILIPAAVTDVINDSNKNTIQAKLIVEGANIPMREEVEEYLFGKGIFIVPDIVANAGGVISSYAEYMGYGADKMFRLVKDKVTASTSAVVKESLRSKENPRKVALRLAMQKVLKARK